MSIEIIVPDSSRSLYENFHFAPAVRHGDLIFCSGQIGQGASAEDEFRSAWQGVEKVLKAAGVGFGDIIEITSYHVGLREHLAAFSKVKDEFIREPYPAWTAIGVAELALPDARVEIRIIARTNSE
jgi:enamine deaminase RidA (YjgF/YER057c/UK114 family)